MTVRTIIKLSLSVFALGGVALAGLATQGLPIAAVAALGPNAKRADAEAQAARKALRDRSAERAVRHAEEAVANDPTNPTYRALLGQAYLLAGRFNAAAQALTDTLALNPADGNAALNLSLAKIAQGDWDGARTLLQSYSDRIPASDRGLAFALAGDPATAIDILTPAAREPDATAKTRQNLALSLALAGRWREAGQLAAMDVPPDALQARMMEWARFAQPTNAYDQVAALLKVRAVEDPGQPAALALARQPNLALASSAAPAAQPAAAEAPVAPPPAQLAARTAAAPVAPVERASEAQPEPQQVAGTGPQIIFGPRQEIVQRITLPPRAMQASRHGERSARPAAPTPVREARAARSIARGSYFVQLGAYATPAIARDAWVRHLRRVPGLSGQTPQGARVATRAGNFYRLSVGGFARTDADTLCRQVKAAGGACFVRVQAGDAVASWARTGRAQLAAR